MFLQLKEQDMKFTREDFPSIFKYHENRPRYQDRFEETLELLNHSLEQGSIRNGEMKDVKSRCSDAASEAYKFLVSEPFVWGQKFMTQPSEVQELEMNISMSGIHSLTSIKKKVDKCKIDNECVNAIRQWLDEYLPLTNAIESLKANVVMGRAPSTGPAKPVNPNKDVKTCPCCFRAIAVVGATMAHHGFRRPGNGMQTSSCPGIRFKPLELTPEGMKYMSKAHGNSIEAAKEGLEKAPLIQSFQKEIRRQLVTITRDDPDFDRYMNAHVSGLERDIRWHTQDKANFDARIAAWKPDMKHKQVAPEDDAPSP